MVKTATLTNIEKHAVQNMLREGISVKNIAMELGRVESTIQEYIEGELSEMHQTIARIHTEKADIGECDPAMFEDALHRLIAAGLDPEDGSRILSRVVCNLDVLPKEAEELYVIAIANIGAREVMVRKTQGGRKGVAIMTSAGSQKGEESGKKARKTMSRTARGAVFSSKTGEAVDG